MTDEKDEFEKWLENWELSAELTETDYEEKSSRNQFLLRNYRSLKPKLRENLIRRIIEDEQGKSFREQVLNEASRYLSKRICDLSEENTKLKQSREQILNDLLKYTAKKVREKEYVDFKGMVRLDHLREAIADYEAHLNGGGR